MPAITDTKSVETYAAQVMEMRGMIANLAEFLDSLPAPDDNEDVQGINYAFLGSLGLMHSHLIAASETADEITD